MDMMKNLFVLILLGVLIYIWYKWDYSQKKDQQKELQTPTPQMWQEYYNYAQAVVDCVSNNYQSVGLVRPGSLAQHMPLNNTGIVRIGNAWYFQYEFDRTSSYCNGQLTYSTVSLQSILARLNATLPNYCIAMGLLPVTVVYGQNIGNGRIRIRLG